MKQLNNSWHLSHVQRPTIGRAGYWFVLMLISIKNCHQYLFCMYTCVSIFYTYIDTCTCTMHYYINSLIHSQVPTMVDTFVVPPCSVITWTSQGQFIYKPLNLFNSHYLYIYIRFFICKLYIYISLHALYVIIITYIQNNIHSKNTYTLFIIFINSQINLFEHIVEEWKYWN